MPYENNAPITNNPAFASVYFQNYQEAIGNSPPVNNHFILLNGQDFDLLNGTNFDLLG